MPELVWAGILGAGALAAAVPYVLRRKRSEERNRKLDELRSSLGQEAPRQLGDYVVVARLGSGAMATVYRALPAGTLDESQAVAIKVMSRALSLDEAHRTRFQREIIALKELSHEHTVRLLAWGEQEGQFYIVMELLEGESLRELLNRRAVIPWQEAVNLLTPCLEALQQAHDLGIVHRDLKPENLFVTPRGVKVVDFGVARSEDMKKATMTGTAMGTPAYMAPEQIAGGLHPATDQYALGCVLYEMLTGSPPFLDEDSLIVIMRHLQEPPPSLRERVPELPAAVERLVLRLLVKDPLRRFPDARHLGQAMARLETSAPRRVGSAVRRPTGEGAEWLSFHQAELEAWRAVPGVAGWTRCFCEDGMAVLEREWVEGSALSAGSRLPPEGVRSLARELLKILEEVHARGLVHGNLKPSNLIMTTSGLRLTDPRLPGEGPTGDPYQAPELVHGAPQPSADQYGVGAVLQSLLTGEPPGESDAGVPVEWRGVLRRMLRAEGEDRFPDLASGLKVILECESRPEEGTLQL